MQNRLDARGWSLASQLVLLQVCVVVTAVGIEALSGVYHGPGGSMSWAQRQLLGLVTLTEVALLVGIAGSLFLADRVRRQTFNMEPAVIARHYQHHHAMLHAVREGLIITEPDGTVVLANDEALRLLRLPPDSEGRRLGQLLARTEGGEWAADQAPVRDEVRLVSGRVLMVSRSPAEVDGRPLGLVTTLRDRTELEAALSESTALRKLTHQFANTLQVIVRLVETGKYDQAIALCTSFAEVPQQLSSQLLDQTSDDVVTALLLDKSVLAKERNVELRLPEAPVAGLTIPGEDLITILGNLLDNAIEAVASGPAAGGWVELSLLAEEAGTLHIMVCDDGPGVSADPLESVFGEGWSTKPGRAPGGRGRGYGLAAVRNTVMRLDGTISVSNNPEEGGAIFAVRLPRAVHAAGQGGSR
jgi:sensor histidine kinase regulating citrate/malate metabolism